MGRGDNIMATGLARGAAARGKRVAFGDGRRIAWDQHSKELFRGNPNIAPPGSEADPDIEWIDYRTGHRIYNRLDRARRRWIWNMDFRPMPGELFFDEHELAWAAGVGAGFVLMEPNVEAFKTWASNKRWPADRYDAVAMRLAADGAEIVQFAHGDHRIRCARQVKAPSFRHALAALARASLYVGPEGGMHHGAAAVGVPGVVLFGGFIPPDVTGYPGHVNLTGGAKACGSLRPCAHCRAAMDRISVEEVVSAARQHLKGRGMKERFEFIGNVPEKVRPLVRPELVDWIEREDFPVFGVKTPLGEVDFCRRPWPPRADMVTTIGSEHDVDEDRLIAWEQTL